MLNRPGKAGAGAGGVGPGILGGSDRRRAVDSGVASATDKILHAGPAPPHHTAV